MSASVFLFLGWKDWMAKNKSSTRVRIRVPLFIGFLVMTVAFIGISYVQFRKYTIEDCVN